MDPHEPFIPRSGPAQIGEQILEFLNRHLTAISVATALIAAALLIAGPVRARLFPPDGTTTAEVGPVAGQAGLISVSGASRVSGSTLSRSLVPFTIIPNRPRDSLVTYTVRPGDTLMGIAETFGLDRNTLFWSNADTLRGDVHMLQPGMDLNILPMDGVMHKSDELLTVQQIADKYLVDVNVILEYEFNEMDGYTPSTVPPWGKLIVIPGGVGEINADMWKPPVVEVTNPVTGTVSYAFMPNMAGSCSASIRGGGGTGSWASPLPGAPFTQPFYPGHSGVDLAMPVGSPAIAADTGVVVFSGWVPADWGYGVLVVLDHGNGWTSYYAHLSSTGVGCGQTVSRGGYVGAVGSTGNSSGPHLHFEMRWNHTPDNPAAYIGF